MGQLTRRSVLGAGIGAATALAGCSSEPSTGPTGTPTGTHPSSLSVERLRFCAEQPTGYRQYDEQPGATYAPGDVVWLYLEPSTVGTEPAGEGQVRFAFDATWTVYAPDGEELETFSDTVGRTVPESNDLSELFLTLNVSPSMPFDEGTHRVEIELEDTFAGTRATRSAEFEVSAPFSIERIRFLEDEPAGYRQYTEQPDAEYRASDTVWVYVEPDSVELEQRDDGDRWYELGVTVRTVGPDGTEDLQVKDTVNNPLAADRDPEKLFLVVSFDLRRGTPGEYTVDIVVHDRVGGERATDSATFTLVNVDQRLLELFERVIEDDPESEMTVERLAVAEGTCRLTYTTESTYGEADFYAEVGFIAGAYAGLIEEGFSAENLRATGHDADDQEFAFEIDSANARAMNEGEISDDDYREHVLGSLHRRG